MSVGYLTEQSIQIARGLVRGASGLHKFGAVPAMSQSATGTIWDINDTVYPWSSFATASVLTAQTVNSSDNGKVLTLVGLDSNYNAITDTITLSNTVTRATTKTFLRVFRGYISTGSNNVGAIDVRISSTTVLHINAGLAQTLMCVYTVPAGKTLYLTQGVCTAQSGADGTGNFFVRFFGETAFRIQHTFEVSGSGGEYEYTFSTPFGIPEKSDIDVRLTTRSNNGRYTAAFDGILFDTPRTMKVQ